MAVRLEVVEEPVARLAIAVGSGAARLARALMAEHLGRDHGPRAQYGRPQGPVHEVHIVLASYSAAVRPLGMAPWVRPFARWVVARGTIEPSGGGWRWVPDPVQHAEDVHDLLVDEVAPALLAGHRHLARVVRT
jgi:hypothetical protein